MGSVRALRMKVCVCARACLSRDLRLHAWNNFTLRWCDIWLQIELKKDTVNLLSSKLILKSLNTLRAESPLSTCWPLSGFVSE